MERRQKGHIEFNQEAESLRRRNAELETRLQERTRELETAIKELEGLSYSISHDLRAPLRTMTAFAEIVQEEHAASLDAEGQRLFGMIARSSRQLNRLMEALLAYSRLSHQELKPVVVDMHSLAHSVVAELCQAHPDDPPAIVIGSLPKVEGDPGLLQQVLSHLIDNALKFSRNAAAPRIELRGQEQGHEILFYVRDNGVGFDMKYATNLFKVFQRLHRMEQFGGSGIGLAMVRRIVERHGGRVWAEGRLNEGATFWFALRSDA